MSVVVGIFLFVVLAVVIARLLSFFQSKISFFATGSDNSFSPSEISLLWKLSQVCKLDRPVSLFYSVESLNRCISKIIEDNRNDGTLETDDVQRFLTKLYNFHTKIELEALDKRGLESSKYLGRGQKLRIILPGNGVFYSEIIKNNPSEIVIAVPKQDGVIKLTGDKWKGRQVSVYLWRKQDACYVFDTEVIDAGTFDRQLSISLKQTDKLIRAQKRRSVRAPCQLAVSLYPITAVPVDYHAVEQSPGYRCVMEDISEDGALVRIGGRGRSNIRIKLQFRIEETLIVMFGVVRSVEYKQEEGQSLLHFECTYLDPVMRNVVLAYVYNVLPKEKQDMYTALAQTEEDAGAAGDMPDPPQDDGTPLESDPGELSDVPVEEETHETYA